MRSAALVVVAAVSVSVSVSVSVAGCFPTFDFRVARIYSYGGTDHVVVDDPEPELGEMAFVRDLAGRAFACSPDGVAVMRPHHRAFIAAGCQLRSVYIVEGTMEPQRRVIPGHDGELLVEDMAAIDVTVPGSSIEPGHDELERWRALIVAGAHDLACPAAQITPDFVPQGRAPAVPIADGCGQRASYISDSGTGLRLLSRVVL